MKNIVFDFWNVLLKSGSLEKNLKLLDKDFPVTAFISECREEIFLSHLQNSDILFEKIMNYSNNKHLSKDTINQIWASNWNDNLISQLPNLFKKYKLYILSNITPWFIETFLKKYNLEQCFEGIVESCNVWYRKPNDKIYQYLLSEYKLNPNETVFFDDKQENIEAAEKNGITGVLFDDFEIDIEEEIKNLDLQL